MLKFFQRFRWWRLLLDSSVASGIALGVTAEEFWVCGRGGFGGFVYSSSSTGLDGLGGFVYSSSSTGLGGLGGFVYSSSSTGRGGFGGVAYSSSLRAEKHYECNLSYSLVCVKS